MIPSDNPHPEQPQAGKNVRENVETGEKARCSASSSGAITFTPSRQGYTFSAQTRFDRLFTGIVAPRPEWLPRGAPRGLGHLTDDETREGDYGRLLEVAVSREREWRARQDSNL